MKYAHTLVRFPVCYQSAFIDGVFAYSQIYCLMVIAIDRLSIAMCHYMKYKPSWRSICLKTFLVWISA